MSSISADPRIGADLLGYRIEALLGRGGMSVVYRAEDLRLKRPVALKLLAPELAEDERFRERFLRESELAASLDHPHIVPIYDAGEHEGQLWIAMRYVEGSDLKRLLKEEGALEPKRALGLLADLADALDAAHERGLVHRDVKPSNALLDGAGHLYLSDFGLTKSASDRSALTVTGRIMGTVDYAAPEQIEGKPVDGRADVYSLGCLLYECLSGQVPFPRDSELAVLWAHVNERPPRLAAYPALDPVLARALAKDPQKRYATCAELVEAAREALGLREVVLVRDRRPLLLAALGALLAAGALAAGLVLSLGGSRSPKPDLTVRGNTLVRIDPKTNKISAVTGVGRDAVLPGAVGVAVGGRTVWVYNWDDSTVRAIDPRTAAVERTVSIGGSPPAGWVNSIAADASGAWVLSTAAGSNVLTHVDPGIELPTQFRLRYDPIAVAVGEGGVWVVAKDVGVYKVLRISPSTGAVLAGVRLPGTGAFFGTPLPTVQSIAVGAGAVWAAQARTLFRIDPATARITGRVNLPAREVVQVAAGEGRVWTLMYQSGGNALARIDPRTLRVETIIPAPTAQGSQNESEASRLAVDREAVWWIGADSGMVFRVDPRTGRIVSTIGLTPPVQSIGGAFQPFGVATGAGGAWVTVTIAP